MDYSFPDLSEEDQWIAGYKVGELYSAVHENGSWRANDGFNNQIAADFLSFIDIIFAKGSENHTSGKEGFRKSVEDRYTHHYLSRPLSQAEISQILLTVEMPTSDTTLASNIKYQVEKQKAFIDSLSIETKEQRCVNLELDNIDASMGTYSQATMPSHMW